MPASLIVEQDSGTWTGSIHPHNGYYAGDFSDVPPATQGQLAALMSLCPDPARRDHTNPHQRGI
jgi:hypothetical protein